MGDFKLLDWLLVRDEQKDKTKPLNKLNEVLLVEYGEFGGGGLVWCSVLNHTKPIKLETKLASFRTLLKIERIGEAST